MTDLIAQSIVRHVHSDFFGLCMFSYGDRFLRKKVLRTDAGRDVLIDLEHTTSLHSGDVFALADGRLIGVVAAPDPLLEVTADGELFTCGPAEVLPMAQQHVMF